MSQACCAAATESSRRAVTGGRFDLARSALVARTPAATWAAVVGEQLAGPAAEAWISRPDPDVPEPVGVQAEIAMQARRGRMQVFGWIIGSGSLENNPEIKERNDEFNPGPCPDRDGRHERADGGPAKASLDKADAPADRLIP